MYVIRILIWPRFYIFPFTIPFLTQPSAFFHTWAWNEKSLACDPLWLHLLRRFYLGVNFSLHYEGLPIDKRLCAWFKLEIVI